MSNMYLYLLGFGVLVFSLFRIFIPNIVSRKGYRLFYNTYNSGVATLINGILLNGILEIAGATSQIVPWFLYIGSGLITAAAIILCRIIGYKDRRCFN